MSLDKPTEVKMVISHNAMIVVPLIFVENVKNQPSELKNSLTNSLIVKSMASHGRSFGIRLMRKGLKEESPLY